MNPKPTESMPWSFPEAEPRTQSITSDWEWTHRPLIDGVAVKEVRNVPTEYGHLVEVWREDWALDSLPMRQVFQSVLSGGQVTAWHAHATTTDRLFVNQGRMRVVLYDSRPGSPTHGMLNQFILGTVRPALLIIPPQVWHGVGNLESFPSALLNLVDEAYRYQEPDHCHLPPDSPRIPFTW